MLRAFLRTGDQSAGFAGRDRSRLPSESKPVPKGSAVVVCAQFHGSLPGATVVYARLSGKDTVKDGERVCGQSSDQNATIMGNSNPM